MISEAQKEFLRKEKVFPDPPEEACRWCGGYHLRACGRIKRQVFVGDGAGTGNLVEIEFWPEWDVSETIWPEDVFKPEDSDE